MKSRQLLVLLAGSVILISGCGAVAPCSCPLNASGPRLKGISFAAWWTGLYSTPHADQALAELAATGAKWVSIIATCYQETVASTQIECLTDTRTPSDADVIHAVREARRLGLRVLLKPHLDLKNDPTHWRGQIDFGSDEAAWQSWFTSYKAFIEHYAQLAQALNVDLLAVGVELEGTSSREADWRAVIAGVRALYSGPLVYAANTYEVFTIAFWDALDIIGADAYIPLTNKLDPTLQELKAGWTPYKAQLAALAQQWGKRVIFTELGYRSLDGANTAPWDWQRSGPVDLQEQADCYQAFFEAVWREPWLAGVFWWVWETDPNQGGPSDTGYTPHGKPAETILKAYYLASP